ncbi:FAD-binding and (Fe-S)-binding domain-containing protein [Chloroflexota bacterium]
MKNRDKQELRDKFGDRVSFERTEMLLYSHDTASLPSVVKRLLKTVPEAVVQPLSTEEVAFLTRFTQEKSIPLTPRGAGTSGWGGALPTRGGIVIDFSRMRRVLEIDGERGTARVEAGVIWNNLEKALNERGLSLRVYPSSAPSATVAGWVAEGGGGIGSYEYGQVGSNIEEIIYVTPRGETATATGEGMDMLIEAEGITGLITEVVVRARKAEGDIPVVASFPSIKHLFQALYDINQKTIPLWHVSFFNATFTAKKKDSALAAAALRPHHDGGSERVPDGGVMPDGRCMALFVYPASREGAVQPLLGEVVHENGGEISDSEFARAEWNDRFYPLRLKRLGPSLIMSEAIIAVPVLRINAVIEEIEKKFPGIAVTATMLSHEEASVLGYLLSDERSPAYTFEFPRSLEIIDVACQHGGCPYSIGLYFTPYARRNLGAEKVRRLAEYKARYDPKGVLNPGKILPQNRNPRLLRSAMGLVKFADPLLVLGRALFRKKPRLAKKIPPQIAHEAYSCAQCGYCIDVCDQYYGRQWESETSRGRWYFLREYLKGNAEFDQMMLDSFLLCTTCQRCNRVCQVQIPIQEMWDKMRGLVVHEKGYHTFPGFEMMASSFLRQSNIWAGARRERAAWLPEDVTPTERGKTAYWAGCTASYVEKDIAQNAVHILKEGGIDFTYLRQDEACCGIPFFAAGKWDIFARAVEHNIKELNKRGVEEVVLSCPGCWVTLNHYYREWAKKLGLPYNIRVRHISEVAADLVKEGKLTFKQAPKDGGRITYHDPCHIGRHGGIYEPPREVLRAIPGVELVEMEHNREDGLCCGSVLSRVGRPPAADAIAAVRMTEAEEAGADIVLTACPCCEVQLRVGARAKGSPVRVLDFSDVIAEALGYDVPDPTHSVLDAWDVFGTAINIMTVEGMAEMMGQMIPEIMEAMPSPMKKMMGIMQGMPAFLRHPMLSMMERLIPLLMPRLLPSMLPALMPRAVELMKEAIPNMPPAMEAMLPEMFSEVMANIMPPMLPRVAPLVAPMMTAYLEEQAVARN